MGGTLLATAIVLLCDGPLRRRILLLWQWIVVRPLFVQVGVLVLAVTLAAVGVHLLLPRSTKHVLHSWMWGPQVNLAARRASAEPTFASDRFVVNLPWYRYGCDFGDEKGWARSVALHRTDIESALRALTEKGIRRVTWFLLADGRSAPPFDSNGMPLPLDEKFWADYDAALDIARTLDIGILWVFLDQKWFTPDHTELGEDGKRVELVSRAAVLREEAKRDRFIEAVLTPLVSRYPHERQILGWVLINEPDNAVRKGFLSSDALTSFVEKGAATIRQHTTGQPVSVAFNDVESMLSTATQEPDLLRHLDFLIFHHYKDHLPPPADYVRSLLPSDPAADSRAMYIGEFDPRWGATEDGAFEFARWMVTLGYDGGWPWSANTLRTVAQDAFRAEKPDPVKSGIGLAASQRVLQALFLPEALPEFRNRRQLSSLPLQGIDYQRWTRWLRDGQTVLRAYVGYDAEQAKKKMAALSLEAANLLNVVEKKRRELTTEIARCVDENQSTLNDRENQVSQETESANRQAALLAETRKQIKALGKDAPELASLRDQEKKQAAWVKEYVDKAKLAVAKVEIAKRALAKCREWHGESLATREKAEARLTQIHDQRAEIDRQRLRDQLYVSFWNSELEWSTRAGLLAVQ